MKPCKDKHTYFNLADFTAEEIARKNKLAMAVIVGKRRICKYCGFESKHRAKLWSIWSRSPPEEGSREAAVACEGDCLGRTFADACEAWAAARGRTGFFSKHPSRYGNTRLYLSETAAKEAK